MSDRQVSLTGLGALLAWAVALAFLIDAWLVHETLSAVETEVRAATGLVAALVAVVLHVRSYMARVSRLVRLAVR